MNEKKIHIEVDIDHNHFAVETIARPRKSSKRKPKVKKVNAQ